MEPIYKCSFCGATYDDPVSRAKCELECDEKIRQKRQEEEKRKLLEQQESRRQELIQLRRQLDEKTRQYNIDYPMDAFLVDDIIFKTDFPFLGFWGK